MYDMPDFYGSKTEYLIWRACERVGVRPPGVVEGGWENQSDKVKAKILAYHNIRSKDKVQ